MTGKPLIVLQGPTAVGKTQLAIDLAQRVGGEIISADSRQIYREMDIGTAKPTPEQQAEVPHHLIDVVAPDQMLSMGEYKRLAEAQIERLHAAGRIPLLVGGTGQYITALVEGWTIPEVPPNFELRSELEAFAAEHGAAALFERLQTLDPGAAERIDYRNLRRVIRALEIRLETGQTMDYTQRKQPPPYQIAMFGLTMDREALYQQADRRIDQMMTAGFLDEVKTLVAKGYDRALPSMSGLGYSQLAAHLAGETDLEEAVEATRRVTHDFIRRQYTWFRGHEAGTRWLDAPNFDRDAWFEMIDRWLQDG